MYELGNILSIEQGNFSIKFNTLFIEITDKCNFRCIHCYNSSIPTNHKQLSPEYIKKTIKQCLLHGLETVILSGGEALLHTKVWEIIDVIHSFNLKCVILTNGSLLSRSYIREFKQKKVDLQISLDGYDAETNDKIRGTGSFDKIIYAFEMINKEKYGSSVSINIVVNKYNYLGLEKIVNLAEDYNLASLGFNFINRIGRATLYNIELNNQQLMHAMDTVATLKNKSKLVNKILTPTMNCRFDNLINGDLFLNPLIDVDGNVYMCEYLRNPVFSIGNIYKEHLSKIMNGRKIKNILELIQIRKDFMSECKKCIYNGLCSGGCLAQISDNNVFSSYYCEVTKLKNLRRLKGYSKK